MNIVFGEAGKKSSASYFISVGDKFYSYSGNLEKGVFIEEIVYNALKKHGLISSDLHQVLIQTEKSVYLIHFNDVLEDFNGESTIEYSREEFSDDAISGYMSDFLLSEEDIIFCEKIDNKWSFLKGNSEEEPIVLDISEIKYTVNVSRKAKLFDFFKKSSLPFLLLIIILFAPVGMYFFGKTYVIESLNKKSFQSKVSVTKYTKVKESLEYSNKITSEKYKKIEEMKDFFEDEKKVEEFMLKYGKA